MHKQTHIKFRAIYVLVLAIVTFFVDAQEHTLKGGIHLTQGVDSYRMEIKFSDKIAAPYSNEKSVSNNNNPQINRINKIFDSLHIQLRSRIAIDKSAVINAKGATSLEEGARFKGLMEGDLSSISKKQMLIIARYLETLPEIDYVDLVPDNLPPPPGSVANDLNYGDFEVTPDLTSNQGYFGENPGINASYAWTQGIFGQDVHVADIEYDWDELHEDLPTSFSDEFLPVWTEYEDHGTAVLGIMGAARNEIGISGGADLAEYRGYGEYPTGRSTAILKALEWLEPGDVMVLEMQTAASNGKYGPADLTKSVWDAVQVATSKGVHVIAAAGNGSVNLDNESDYMNRGDNGSIIVGAGDNTLNHEKVSFSSYGSRVNLQGWGNYTVFTTGYGSFEAYDGNEHREYTKTFSGTSSATSMVATAVILVQSWAKKELGIILEPMDLRDLLIDTGSAQGGLNSSNHIGPIPNVEAAIKKLQGFPLIDVNETLVLDEGKSATITLDLLSAYDNTASNQELIFTISTQPIDGQIENIDAPGIQINHFSNQDIIDEKIIYQHDDSNTNFDDFTFSISDGENLLNGQVFNININSIDDDPPSLLENSQLVLDEGQSEIISLDYLSAVDTEVAEENIVFTITSNLLEGQMENISKPNQPIFSWTQEELALGSILYRHSGSNTVTDAMTFTISDGINELEEQVFSILINPIDDDPPSLLINSTARIDEGAQLLFSDNQLNAEDTEASDSDVLFIVTTDPLYGLLYQVGDPTVKIDAFSLASLLNGEIYYQHDGSNTTSDLFTFRLTDGINDLESLTFNFTINPIDDDPPEILANELIELDEGGIANIRLSHLNAADTEAENESILFEIISSPTNGTLQNLSFPDEDVTSFTLNDLKNENIVYIHDDSETITDNFEFVLTDGLNPILAQTFSFSILPVDDDPPFIETNEQLLLEEGATLVITTDYLNASDTEAKKENITFTSIKPPLHGHLANNSEPEIAILTFSQLEIEENQIIYIHDHSNSIHDQFELLLSDGFNEVSGIEVTITIESIDDDAPEIVSLMQLQVDEGDTVLLTSDNLLAGDTEFEDELIGYFLTNNPQHGKLVYMDSPHDPVSTFTQLDIVEGKVSYIHDGSNSLEDVFNFELSDGTNLSDIMEFQISILPMDDDAPFVEVNNTLTLSNTANPTIITVDLLSAGDTEAAGDNLVFTIVEPPSAGKLINLDQGDDPITSFTQEELIAGVIAYVHTDYSQPLDSFTFVVSDGVNVSESFSFEMAMEFITGLNEGGLLKPEIYPNPSYNLVTISMRELIDEIAIINVSGKVVQLIKPYNNKIQLDISRLPSAVYVLKIRSGKEVITDRLVIHK